MRALSACSRGFCLTTVLLSLVFRLFPPSDASVFQDLPYKELNIRSFNLKSPFAIVSSAKEVYDLKEAQEVNKHFRLKEHSSLVSDIFFRVNFNTITKSIRQQSGVNVIAHLSE